MFTRNCRRSSGVISNYGQSAQVELLENRLLLTAPIVLSLRGDVAMLNPLIEWTPVEGAASYNVWVAENGQQAGRRSIH